MAAPTITWTDADGTQTVYEIPEVADLALAEVRGQYTVPQTDGNGAIMQVPKYANNREYMRDQLNNMLVKPAVARYYELHPTAEMLAAKQSVTNAQAAYEAAKQALVNAAAVQGPVA